ncbi:type IV secretion system protein [Arsenophonus nasoniae]|uniref:Type IV secretion system protein n=1 Tax=Arsenophonus nasoniae TaxID=638 RepID=A0AA95GBH9_9GAMM|nr:type IV secretion system protein [Arsenophonus nasoniae]WGL93958.1 type IV secretion system protein [Arsenophonus nasoniae]
MAGFFEKFSRDILGSVDKISDAYQSQYAQGIIAMASSAIVIYILWKGYQTLAGKSQTPVQDLVWDLSKFAIILMFIQNIDGYLTAATDALQGLKEGFAGQNSVWTTLDRLFESTQKLGKTIHDLDPSTYIKDEGLIGQALVWAGSMILMMVSTVVFITAEVTMKLLVVTAPIFIFCLMFGFLRTMFNNWLQALFSSIFTILFATLVIKIAMDYQGEILAQVLTASKANSSNLITMGAMGFLAGALSALLVTIAKGFASQLAGVGVEGAVQGMATMGLGAAGWATGKSIGMGTRFSWGAGKGLIGMKGANSLSGKAGNLLGQGAKTAAEWAGEKGHSTFAPTGALGAKARRLASLEKARQRWAGK